jgi:hypothetical protein
VVGDGPFTSLPSASTGADGTGIMI